MSVNKIKSLKLQRHNESAIKLEDTSIVLIDETVTEQAEKSSKNQETLTPVHSTPKRSMGKSNGNQEQLQFHVSPMLLPCTQDGGNEVAWDWQSPLGKSTTSRKSRNNGEQIGTPKRTNLLQKKRNSNSPLLYKPIKRKLMKNDNQQECIKIFTAELKALSEQIKTLPRDEENRIDINENKNVSLDEFLTEVDIKDFDDSETKIDTKSDESTLSRTKAQISAGKTSLDDFFDDSIEESMVKCSQEVEEKLRLETCRKNSSRTSSSDKKVLKDFAWHQQSYTSFLASREKPNTAHGSSSAPNDNKSTKKISSSSSQLSTTTSDSKKICKITSTLSNSTNEHKKSNKSINGNVNSSKSSLSPSKCNNVAAIETESVPSSVQSEIFEIPDDSFDEDFLAVSFDNVENHAAEETNSESNQTSNRYGKFYTSPHANVPSDSGSHKFVGTTPRKLLLAPSVGTSCKSMKIQGRNDSNKILSSSNGILDTKTCNIKSTMHQQSQSSSSSFNASTNSSRKFFKTKSLSTSNFDDCIDNRGQSSSSVSTNAMTSGTRSAALLESNLCPKSSSVSTEQQQQRQQQQQQQHHQRKISSNTLSNNAWQKKNGEHNNGIENFNRNAPRDDGSSLKMTNDSIQRHNGVKEGATGSQSICTPEEIERKRQEAKMRLEMKRKLQARSKSAGLLPDYASQRPPVKR